MKASFISNSTALVATRAIILYETESGPETTCSIHRIQRPKFAAPLPSDEGCGTSGRNGTEEFGPPMILPGEALAPEALQEIFAKLAGSQKHSRSLMPENVLCAEQGRLIWYLPSHRRLIFFKTGSKELDAINGKEVRHPALLFVAENKNLYVWALSSDARPNGKTVLYRAPYFNVWAGGRLCQGSVRCPKTVTPRDIPAWENIFFDTNFSHSNASGAELTSHPGGHTGLWLEMSKTGRGAPKTFSAKYLVRTKKKVEHLLNGAL